MKIKHGLLALAAPLMMNAQNVMTPETLWTLGRLSVEVVSPDQTAVIYKVGKTDLKSQKSDATTYFLDLKNLESHKVKFDKKSVFQWDANGLYARKDSMVFISKDAGKTWTEFYKIGKKAENIVISPDGKQIAFTKPVQVEKILGKDRFEDTPKSTAQVYTDLNYRHWDTWYEGEMNHLFWVSTDKPRSEAKDLLEGKKFMVPQQPFGGTEDILWSPDSSELLYVTKESYGAEYAQSTNTDIFAYNLASGTTRNLTEENKGYDVNPKFSPDGSTLTWMRMKTPGYEADKADIMIMKWKSGEKTNLTAAWDDSVDGGFYWAKDSKMLYFNAAFRGVKQLFFLNPKDKKITQITRSNYDVNAIVAETAKGLLINRVDFNHSADLYNVSLKTGEYVSVTDINQEMYARIKPSQSELRMVKTSDGKEMGVWFIYPPDFDPTKKYPTLLYTQGGPQSALTQFFSIRWNFALMAANGYVVVAPNRRGMPGWGVQWNADISEDWGGQPMRDYLAAADYAKTLPFVDGDRMGAVGASYGGYSVFMLAGIHQNRFKTFIAHDGLFDMKSWYGTTEELWFANHDIGGPYWKNPQPKAYTEFNPSNYVDRWTTPIMIVQGGIDFRVGIEQGLEAFQAARLRGLKAKLLYFPDENHWVLHPQNGLVWQREFFNWLKETL